LVFRDMEFAGMALTTERKGPHLQVIHSHIFTNVLDGAQTCNTLSVELCLSHA
jgi:hypothetical protein